VSDYLFDKQGEPDPEVERLERVLSPLAYRGVAPRLPQRRARRGYVVAATLSAIAAAMLLALLLARPWHPAASGWAATVRDGAASRDGHALTGATQLPVGAWLDTGSAHVRLVVADIGTVELSPRTRARIVATGPTRHELQLERGTLVAAIDAPPRRFVVATPRAVVTHLGCAVEQSVDESGRLVVTGGRVAVLAGGAPEVVVPAGARVDLSEHGAGAPYVPAARQPATPPTPPTPPTHATAPTPTPTPTPSHATAPIHPSKPSRHATHAPAVPSSKQAAPKTPPATSPHDHAQPPRKSETSPKIGHDSLKELERSGE
jgi:ferric-dicitrate binding protein FerR (iron transport regulator)